MQSVISRHFQRLVCDWMTSVLPQRWFPSCTAGCHHQQVHWSSNRYQGWRACMQIYLQGQWIWIIKPHTYSWDNIHIDDDGFPSCTAGRHQRIHWSSNRYQGWRACMQIYLQDNEYVSLYLIHIHEMIYTLMTKVALTQWFFFFSPISEADIKVITNIYIYSLSSYNYKDSITMIRWFDIPSVVRPPLMNPWPS